MYFAFFFFFFFLYSNDQLTNTKYEFSTKELKTNEKWPKSIILCSNIVFQNVTN